MVYRNAIAFLRRVGPRAGQKRRPAAREAAWRTKCCAPPGAEVANPPAAEAEQNVVGLKALLRKKLVEQAWIDEETFSSTFDFTLRDTFGYLFDATFHMAELGLMSFFYLTFFILDRHKFAHRVQRAFEPEQADHLLEVGRQINTGLEQYIQVKTLISGGMGLSSAVILYFFGVPYWVLWAFLFFALNYITYVGSIAACVPPVVVTLLHYPSPWVAVWLLVVLVVHRLIWIRLSRDPPLRQGAESRLDPDAPLAGLLGLGLGRRRAGAVGADSDHRQDRAGPHQSDRGGGRADQRRLSCGAEPWRTNAGAGPSHSVAGDFHRPPGLVPGLCYPNLGRSVATLGKCVGQRRPQSQQTAQQRRTRCDSRS